MASDICALSRPPWRRSSPVSPVFSKIDFYRRLRAGEFHWFNGHQRYYDITRWPGGPGLWAIQSIGPPGSPCHYNLTEDEVRKQVPEWPLPYVISQMLPDEWIGLQGEVWGDYCHVSTAKVPMRQALKTNPVHLEGTKAKVYLAHHLPPEDLEDMMAILDRYPGHVVEFSTYGVPVGTLRRRTVFWEVRAY